MYNVTQAFKDAIKRNGRDFRAAITIADTNTFDDNNIIDITLNEDVNPADSFMIGSVASSKLEVTLINIPSLVLDGTKITPEIGINTVTLYEDVPLGVFWIDEIKKDKNTIKLTCFDSMIKLEGAYFSDLNYPASINAVAQEICSKTGVQLATALPSTLINKIEGYTYREAISFIASFLGGFARFNRNGKLEITTYNSTDTIITADHYYKAPTTGQKAFTIGKLTCKVADQILTSGANGNEISFENPIMTQAQLDSIYNNLKTFSYMPYDMDWIGNHALQAGDKISIVDKNSNTFNTLLMQNQITYKGAISAKASAKGKTDQAQAFNYNGSITTKVDKMLIEQANIKNLLAETATIENLNATNARIDTANINIASINTLLAGNLTAANMQANFITANSGLIANGAINDAMINNLSVSKILAGDISTNKFRIISDAGNMQISDNTIQIKDSTRVRVQIGKDASNDYNMYVWDSSGNLMFDAAGLKASGIKSKIIRDDMVSDTANINGSKIEKESLVTQVNSATTTLKASKVKLDSENQTLDLAFTSLKTTVSNQGTTITNQGTSIGTIQGQISSKIWSSDITTAVNNITIGGRNLLTNSAVERTGPATGSNKEYVGINITSVAQAYLGKQITISFDLKSAVAGSIQVYSLGRYKIGASQTFSVTSDYQRYSVTGIFSYGATTDANGEVCTLSFYGTYGTGRIPSIKNIKIELGNKATDWTPAPEDIDSQITTINTNYSSLNQTVNSISTSVSSLQTTTSDLGTRMISAESSITSLNSSIILRVATTDFNSYKANNDSNISSLQSRISAAELKITDNSIISTVRSSTAYTSDLSSKANQSDLNTTNTNVSTAQNTANAKRRVFTSTPITPYDVGDLWVTTNGTGDLMTCKTARASGSYTATDWVKGVKYTDDTTANTVQGNLNTTNSNLSALTTRVSTAESSITQLNNSISLKVNTSDFNTLTGRVSNTESNISVLQGQINSKVNVGDMGTLITQNANSVKVAVGKIGGANLIKNSGFDFGNSNWSYNGNFNFRTDQVWQIYNGNTGWILSSGQTSGIYQRFYTTVGQKYTVSFVAQRDGGQANGNTYIGIEGIWSVNLKDTVTVWKQYTYTFTATSNVHTIIIYADSGTALFIDNIKVEEGENVTSWSLHPSELKNSSFEVTEDHARFTSSDGSYTEFTPSTTGLKWHQGGNTYDYFYLTASGIGQINIGQGAATITLPDTFKYKKNIVVTVTPTGMDLGTDSNGHSLLMMGYYLVGTNTGSGAYGGTPSIMVTGLLWGGSVIYIDYIDQTAVTLQNGKSITFQWTATC